jgi:hypothetical protein
LEQAGRGRRTLESGRAGDSLHAGVTDLAGELEWPLLDLLGPALRRRELSIGLPKAIVRRHGSIMTHPGVEFI